MSQKVTLGSYIKSVRRKKGLPQGKTANQLMITGQYLNDLESNRRSPSDDVLERLSALIGLDSDYAFYLIGKFPPDLRGNKTIARIKRAYKILRATPKQQNLPINKKPTYLRGLSFWQPCLKSHNSHSLLGQLILYLSRSRETKAEVYFRVWALSPRLP